MAFWREARAFRRISESETDRNLFERTGDMEALQRALASGREAVKLAPAESSWAPIAASTLSRALRMTFDRTRDDNDLREAVALADRALAGIVEGGPNWSSFHNEVAIVRLAAFERFDSPDDLTRALAAAEVAAATAAAGADRGGKLANLANVHRTAYDRFGETRHLNEAIELGHRAVAALPPGAAPLPIALTVLFVAHQQRFDVVGRTEVLDEAIVLGREAVKATRTGDPELAGRLSNLAVAHTKRYLHTHASEDLDDAITLATRAVEATPPGHPDLALYLTSLGNALRRRGERTSSVADLSDAVTVGWRAVEIQPRALGWQANLVNNSMALYRRTGDADVLEEAISLGERLLAQTPGDHRQLPRWRSNLGIAYLDRFHSTNVTADLHRAVELSEQAVAATAPDHPERVAATAQLYLAYQERLDSTGRGVTVSELREAADWIDDAPPSSAFHRVQIGRAVGRIASSLREHELASRVLAAAVSALPTVAPRTLHRKDQEHSLSQHAGLAGEAVAAQLAAGEVVRAVELAETGRGVLLASALNIRYGLALLAEVDPALAQRLQFAQDQLLAAELPAVGRDSAAGRRTPEEVLAQRRRDYEAVLDEARRLPGFSSFVRPPSFDQLRPHDDGIVVVVNVSPDRGDAIIVRGDADPFPVRLPGLRHDEVMDRALELWNATAAISTGSWAASLRARRIVGDVLSWLWDHIAGPVADALPAGRRHRLWWLPIGPLGLFPLHAAGVRGEPGMLDLAVSSYTPTLRALARSRDQPPAEVRRQLTVALAETPSLPGLPLPATAAEALALAEHAPDGLVLRDGRAITTEVLTALGTSTWAHFACHAVVDPASPSTGGLHLHDGQLSVGTINGLRLDRAELAYLSACSTARTGLRHADEAVHLASAFHLAGYRHVIGSLWPLGDKVASQAAHAFYRELPPASSSGDFASVLHRVVRGLRDDHADRPELWAALIHSGP